MNLQRRARILSGFIKHMMNERLMRLERHEGEQRMTEFSILRELHDL